MGHTLTGIFDSYTSNNVISSEDRNLFILLVSNTIDSCMREQKYKNFPYKNYTGNKSNKKDKIPIQAWNFLHSMDGKTKCRINYRKCNIPTGVTRSNYMEYAPIKMFFY